MKLIIYFKEQPVLTIEKRIKLEAGMIEYKAYELIEHIPCLVKPCLYSIQYLRDEYEKIRKYEIEKLEEEMNQLKCKR